MAPAVADSVGFRFFAAGAPHFATAGILPLGRPLVAIGPWTSPILPLTPLPTVTSFTLTTASSYLPPIMTLHDRHSHGCATGIIVAVNSTPRLLP